MTSAGGAAHELSCEAAELCRPSPPRYAKTARAGDPASGARHRFCLLPWAYALGYLLDAPTTLGHQGKGDINRRESYLACTKSFYIDGPTEVVP